MFSSRFKNKTPDNSPRSFSGSVLRWEPHPTRVLLFLLPAKEGFGLFHQCSSPRVIAVSVLLNHMGPSYCIFRRTYVPFLSRRFFIFLLCPPLPLVHVPLSPPPFTSCRFSLTLSPGPQPGRFWMYPFLKFCRLSREFVPTFFAQTYSGAGPHTNYQIPRSTLFPIPFFILIDFVPNCPFFSSMGMHLYHFTTAINSTNRPSLRP